jgi:hypothetical protein
MNVAEVLTEQEMKELNEAFDKFAKMLAEADEKETRKKEHFEAENMLKNEVED